MKKMKRIYTITTIIMTALALAGCAKELEEDVQKPDAPQTDDETMVLGAVLPDSPVSSDSADAAAPQSVGTKTTISDNGDKTYSVFWAEGDAISVNGKISKDINIDKANPKNATFTLDVVDAPYCAVYPAGAIVADSFSAESDTLNVTVPQTQAYRENDFDQASAIMSAYSKSASAGLVFKHTMAYIKLTVTNAAIKSVRINGNNNEAISGVFTVKFSETGNSFAPRKDEKGKTKGNTSVTYSNGDAAIAANTPMFIAIPAADYQKGLTFTIVDSENHYQVKKTSAFTANAGKVYPTETEFVADGTYVDGGIYTAEDWNNFILDLNAGDYSKWVTTIGTAKGVHLMADIDYQYNLEASNTTEKLENIVYGHDHTITHHPVRPMFTNIGENGGIFNLTIAGDTDTWDNTGWAGVFATNNSGQIRKCNSRVNFNLDKPANTQTIILASGICRTNNSTGYVMDCYNYGAINISNPDKPVRIGGVLLYNDGGNFARCYNEGSISVTGVNVGCVVGGVAYAISGTSSALENHGNVSIDASLSAAQTIYLGGVIANAEYNGKCVKLSDCKNTGSLSIHKTGESVMKGGAIGGVVAAINAGVKGTEGSTFTGMTNCSNEGSLSFVEEETGTTHYGYAIGGVLGRCVDVKDVHYLNSGYYAILRGAKNTGDITVYSANGQKAAVGNSGARQTYVGGLAGYVCGVSASDKAIVRGTSNCTITTGSAQGGEMVGGLVGGGAMLSIDTKPSATTVFKSYKGKPMGYLGAALGWAGSKDNVAINGATAVATFDTGTVTPLAEGFAGVVSKATLNVTGCQYQGKAVTDADVYGGGTKTIK